MFATHLRLGAELLHDAGAVAHKPIQDRARHALGMYLSRDRRAAGVRSDERSEQVQRDRLAGAAARGGRERVLREQRDERTTRGAQLRGVAALELALQLRVCGWQCG